jgi:hypothetical protein
VVATRWVKRKACLGLLAELRWGSFLLADLVGGRLRDYRMPVPRQDSLARSIDSRGVSQVLAELSVQSKCRLDP